MTSNQQWTCDGTIKNPQYQGLEKGFSHSPRQVYGNACIQCGLPKEAVLVSSATTTTNSSPSSKLGWMLLVVALILGGLGFAAYSLTDGKINNLFSIFNRRDSGNTGDSCNIKEPKEEPERYSFGERTFFPQNSNLDRDRAIEEFRNENYQLAEQHFKQATEAAHNDPESWIYMNNAKARAQENCPLTLALVVPVNYKGTSAEEMMRGVADAQQVFNTNQPQNNLLLQILIINDDNKPEVATTVAQYIRKNQAILGVIGHNSSDATNAAIPSYEKSDLPVISPTSTSTSLKNPVFFRTVPSDAATAKFLAEYAENQFKSRKIAVFHDSASVYSQSLLTELENSLYSATIVVKVDLDKSDLDLTQEIKNSIKAGADTAILFPSTESTSIAVRVAKENYKLPPQDRMQLLGGDSLYNPDTLVNGGEAIQDIIVAVPLIPSSYYADLAQHWGGRLGWRTPASFDATNALTQAIENINSPEDINRQNILNQLKTMEISGNSGETPWRFNNGERNINPFLAQPTKCSIEAPCPEGSQFGFNYLK